MKKFLNKPEKFVDEMLQGIYAAHPDKVKYVNDDLRCFVNVNSKKGKVGIVTGGGSGHLPLFLGYVGNSMLDGCAVGGVFQSPSSEQMFEVTKAVNQGSGVLYIYGNYGGDIMNFDMSAEMADMEDIKILQVVAGEDVASAPKGQEQKRRGVAGIFFVYKTAGAAAEKMYSLEEVKRVADKASANVRTMGVALSACIVPEVGKPSFTIEDGEMEIGMGIHGEPGIDKGPLKTADEITDVMVGKIIEDLPYKKGDEVAVLINGLGATPQEELYVIYRKVSLILKDLGISVFHVFVGEIATSMEMAGLSISFLKLDDELKELLAMPADTPFYKQFQL